MKLESGLQEDYELKIKIFSVRDEYGDVIPVKQEEAGPKVNVKLEDSHSQIDGQEHYGKPESNQSHSQVELYQAEDTNSGNSKKHGSYSPVKPRTLCYEEEFAL